MKFHINPTVRVSFGLIMLTLSILFVGDWLGLVPREQKLEQEYRKQFSESLAITFSSMAQSEDERHIRTTLEGIVKRNGDIQSAAFRSLQSDVFVAVGDHAANWSLEEDGEYSTYDQIIVPIFRNGDRWGSVEIKFDDSEPFWYSAISRNSFITLVLFVAISGFLLYFLFLRRVLRQLDPSQVIPARVKAAFDSLAEGVLILDEEENIVLANTAFIDNASLNPETIVGTRIGDLNWSAYKNKGSGGQHAAPWAPVIAGGQTVVGQKLTIHKDSNLERSYAVNCTPILDGKDNVRGVVATFDDLTELEKRNTVLSQTLKQLKQSQVDIDLKNRELQQLATKDSLTNCLNRRAFNELYGVLFEEALSSGGNLCCLMIDIDYFKRINDNYGHGTGDKVIQFVANVLKKQTRKHDLLARYGGEEFCVVLDGASPDNALAIAERMRTQIIEGDPSLFTSALRVTASFGLASISDELTDKDELVNKADKALYLAKESGRNKVMRWESGLEELPPAPQQAAGDSGLDAAEAAQETPDTGGKILPFEQQSDADKRIRQLEKIAEEKAQQFDHYVSYDPLTQLPVRNLFIDRVEQALLRAKREGHLIAVISLSLHDLRRVNDTLGHESAEELLQVTTERLKHVLRGSDSVSLILPDDPETSISKLNEGEFGILLPSVRDSESITWIVKRIFDRLQEPLFIGGHNLTIHSSVGVGVYPTDGPDAITLIKNASISRYHAEQQPGVGNVEYFSEEINRISREQLNLESQMSSAIENGEFKLLYQPKIHLASGEITGFEALLRWNHPVRGMLAPNEFMEIAERTRLINLIGDWVLQEACVEILGLSKACGRQLSLAVNLSPVQFSQVDLSERILSIVRETGMGVNNLELELTESCLLENMETTLRSLTELRDSGISISIDDFGTGYSGLSYLKTLPVNILKVDRRFVADIAASEHDRAIVFAIFSMARALDLKVIAEGVENNRQRRALMEMDCEEAQGYLFSRPVTADKALDLLRQGPSCQIVSASGHSALH